MPSVLPLLAPMPAIPAESISGCRAVVAVSPTKPTRRARHVRIAQAHRLHRADRHRGRGLRVLPLRAGRRRPDRRHLQHRRLAAVGVREGSRPGCPGRRPISARAASTSSSTVAGRWWWRAAPATRRSSSATSRPASKVKATTAVRAGMEALRHVGARRIAIASPYPKRHNEALTGYLTTQRLRGRPRSRRWTCRSRRCRTCRPRTSAHSRPARLPPRPIATRSTCRARSGRPRRWSMNWSSDTGKLVVAYTHACFLRGVPRRWA